MVLAGVGIALIGVALNHLIRAGTCASGGPYEIAHECPSGTGAWRFAIPPALLVVLASPWISGRPEVFGRLVWVGGFVALGINAIVLRLSGGLGPDAGSRFGAVVLAVTFLALGLVPAIFVAAQRLLRRGGRPRPADGPESARRSAQHASAVDLVAQLQELSTHPGGHVVDGRNVEGLRDAVLGAVSKSGRAESSSSSGTDPLDRLQKLADLHVAGVLTDAEFQEQKGRILRAQ